jgi:hypothetical protein
MQRVRFLYEFPGLDSLPRTPVSPPVCINPSLDTLYLRAVPYTQLEIDRRWINGYEFPLSYFFVQDLMSVKHVAFTYDDGFDMGNWRELRAIRWSLEPLLFFRSLESYTLVLCDRELDRQKIAIKTLGGGRSRILDQQRILGQNIIIMAMLTPISCLEINIPTASLARRYLKDSM